MANDRTDSIARLLGQGTFGKVVEAFDKKKRSRCAIKIIRSVQKYRDASRIELRVLQTLSLNDKSNRNKCIHLRDCFDFRNHICIVTDLLGQSVFDFLKGNAFVPFPSSQIQNFARQLLTSVACKRCPEHMSLHVLMYTISSPRPQPHTHRSKAREHLISEQYIPDIHLQSTDSHVLNDEPEDCTAATSAVGYRDQAD